MKRIRRALPLIVAVVLLGLATALALFAADVRAWQGAFTQGDVRFRAQRAHIGLWRSPAVLPADPARSVLGLDDALSYRRAVQLFWLAQIGTSTGGQADLQALMESAPTAEERSNAANLLGVMTVTAPANSPTQKAEISTARAYFQQAVIEDPTNYNAKINLEVLLRVAHPGKSKLDQDARGGFGFGGSNGVGVVGGGL